MINSKRNNKKIKKKKIKITHKKDIYGKCRKQQNRPDRATLVYHSFHRTIMYKNDRETENRREYAYVCYIYPLYACARE